jgi:hypothetical protein
LAEVGVDGKIILRWIFKKIGWEIVDRINPAQDSDKWGALVNTAIDLRVV